jgi:CBS domain-containing protein
MVRHVIAVEGDTAMASLADVMVKHAVKRMLVVRDGRVVGTVSRSDLMVAIARSQ